MFEHHVGVHRFWLETVRYCTVSEHDFKLRGPRRDLGSGDVNPNMLFDTQICLKRHFVALCMHNGESSSVLPTQGPHFSCKNSSSTSLCADGQLVLQSNATPRKIQC